MTRSPISLPGRTIIFDYGEVISLPPSATDREVITSLAGVGCDSEPFWQAYFAHRDGLDQGSAGVGAYWRAIADDLGASWDDARMHELWAADFRSWLSINPGTIEVLADLRPAALSWRCCPTQARTSAAISGTARSGTSSRPATSAANSACSSAPRDLPDMLDDLGISAAQAVFIDNRQANVRGAVALGITGHLFTDVTALRAFLASLCRDEGISW